MVTREVLFSVMVIPDACSLVISILSVRLFWLWQWFVCSSLIFSGYNFVLLRMQLRTISLQRPLPNLNQDTGHLQGTVRVSVSVFSLLLYFWYSLFFYVPHKFASNLWYLCPDDVVICGVLLWGTFSSWPDTVPSLQVGTLRNKKEKNGIFIAS